MRPLALAAFLTLASTLQAATISTTGPASGLTRVIVDQPYGQFTKVGLTGATLQPWTNDEFWTNSAQVWITDYLGVGSLHTLLLAPEISLIAVRPTYGPEGVTQEFSYEYHLGTRRQELGPVSLPYGAASVGSVPEPATALLGVMGAGVFLAMRRLA